MKNRGLILQLVFGASLLLLFFSACIKSSQPNQVSEAVTTSSPIQPTATLEAVNNQITTTTVDQEPQPTKTLTVSPSPILTTQPISAMFGTNQPLGVRFNIPGFAHFVHLPNEGFSFLIHQPHREKELIIVDANTGRQLKTISYASTEIDYAADSNLIVLVESLEETTRVEAHAIFSDDLVWQIDMPTVSSPYIFLFEDLVLLLDDSGIDQATFYLLEYTTGNLIWQKQHSCLIAHSAQLVRGNIEVDCGSTFLNLDPMNGDKIEQVELDFDTRTIESTISGDTRVFIRKSWEHENGYQVENTYLESVKLDTDEILWSFQVPADVWDFVVYDSDIVYRTGSHLIRLNPATQEMIWQLELLSEVQTKLLLIDTLLLVGSHAGYLHLVDVETGVLLWEQDIWATIEPRVVYIDPLGIVGNNIIIFTEKGIVSLGYDGRYTFNFPTPLPAPTLMPTPTQTPHPIFTPPPSGVLPPAPPALDDWPAAISAFLNSQPQNSDQLESLLESWQNAPYLTGKQTDFDWQEVDLTGNGLDEILIRLSIEDYATRGRVIVLQQNLSQNFEVAYAQHAGVPQLFALTDLNSDGITDFIYNDTVFGASSSSTILYPISWNGQEFINLAVEPIALSNVRPDTIKVEDVTGDGNLEIILRGGTYGSLAAGPNRESTFTYTWSDDGYILLSQEPNLPQEYFFFLVEANQLLTAGKIEEAITIFEESMFSEDAFARDDHQLAFAEFQLMLAYLMLDDEESAAVWAESGNYPDQLYTEAKEIFWLNYQATNDWTLSAEAARKRIRMGGYAGAQLVFWVGYANDPLTLEDICPCPDCLQGTLGSPFFP